HVPVLEPAVQNSSDVVVIFEGCGPPSSSTEKTPPADLAAIFPPKAFREYPTWGPKPALIASDKFGLPRPQTGATATYFDTHAKYVNYGIEPGMTKNERLARINAVFPLNVAVAPWTAKPSDKWTWDDSGTP